MPRSRFDELVALAEEKDGLVTAEQARSAGFTDSVLARLVQRENESNESPEESTGFPIDRFSQYREAVLGEGEPGP